MKPEWDEVAGRPKPIPGVPYSLLKALTDPFYYALGLRDGSVVLFESARLSDDLQWVHLSGNTTQEVTLSRPAPGLFRMPRESQVWWSYTAKQVAAKDLHHVFQRGLDVRLSEIIWVADAPFGS